MLWELVKRNLQESQILFSYIHWFWIFVLLFICYAFLGISVFLQQPFKKIESLLGTHTLLIQYLYTDEILILSKFTKNALNFFLKSSNLIIKFSTLLLFLKILLGNLFPKYIYSISQKIHLVSKLKISNSRKNFVKNVYHK